MKAGLTIYENEKPFAHDIKIKNYGAGRTCFKNLA